MAALPTEFPGFGHLVVPVGRQPHLAATIPFRTHGMAEAQPDLLEKAAFSEEAFGRMNGLTLQRKRISAMKHPL